MRIKTNKNIAAKKKGKTLVLIVVLALLAGKVFLAIDSATNGAEIAVLQEKEEKIQLEKKELTAKLVEFSSLNGLGEKASEMGFSKPQKVVYVDKGEGFAIKLP